MSRVTVVQALLCLSIAGHVAAHEHHSDDIPEGEGISAEPIACIPLNQL